MAKSQREGRPSRSSSDQAVEALAYTIRSLCDVTGLGRTTIYTHITAGTLIPIKVGRRTIVLRSEAERWLQSLAEPEPVKRASPARQ